MTDHHHHEPEPRRDVIVTDRDGSSAGVIVGVVLAVVLALILVWVFAFNQPRDGSVLPDEVDITIEQPPAGDTGGESGEGGG